MNETTKQAYLRHLESTIEMFEQAQQIKQKLYGIGSSAMDGEARGVLARARNLINSIMGENSTYAEELQDILSQTANPEWKAELAIGLLKYVKRELEDGLLTSFTEMVRGELFDSYLEMAVYLLNEGYKDAAAVIAGATLEAHLKQIAVKYNVDISISRGDSSLIPKKAQQLNQDLGKVAYSSFDQKQITTWLDLRNNAAHGNFGEYNSDLVKRFIEWLHDFIERNPS